MVSKLQAALSQKHPVFGDSVFFLSVVLHKILPENVSALYLSFVSSSHRNYSQHSQVVSNSVLNYYCLKENRTLAQYRSWQNGYQQIAWMVVWHTWVDDVSLAIERSG